MSFKRNFMTTKRSSQPTRNISKTSPCPFRTAQRKMLSRGSCQPVTTHSLSLCTRSDVILGSISIGGSLAKYSYAPQGWINIEGEQNAIRTLALELLQGTRPLPIVPFQASPVANKFPPPPSKTA